MLTLRDVATALTGAVVVLCVGLALGYTYRGPVQGADLDPEPAETARRISELYDVLRCNRTSTFPTADGAERTIVIFVCRDDSPELPE